MINRRKLMAAIAAPLMLPLNIIKGKEVESHNLPCPKGYTFLPVIGGRDGKFSRDGEYWGVFYKECERRVSAVWSLNSRSLPESNLTYDKVKVHHRIQVSPDGEIEEMEIVILPGQRVKVHFYEGGKEVKKEVTTIFSRQLKFYYTYTGTDFEESIWWKK